MNTEPYRIFWDDELWLARRLREASADPAGEDRRQTASGKKDSGISRITDRKSPNGESRVPQPFAGTEVPGEKRLPAAISRQTDPETETAFNPAGPETKHSGYGQATAAYAPATEPFPAIQKPVRIRPVGKTGRNTDRKTKRHRTRNEAGTTMSAVPPGCRKSRAAQSAKP